MPVLTVNLSERAAEILKEFSRGSGWDSDEIIITELIYSMKEIVESMKGGNPKNIEGIVSTFTRFARPS